MKPPRLLAFGAALLAVPLSLGAAWLACSCVKPVYEGHARLRTREAIEILTPDVVVAACDLLNERGTMLELQSPLDSDADELLRRMHEATERDADGEVIVLSYRTPAPDEAVPALTAVIDAFVRSVTPRSTQNDESESLDAEKLELADAIQRQQTTIEGLLGRGMSVNANSLPATDGVSEADQSHADALNARLTKAQERRIASENLIEQSRHDLASGVSVETIIPRIGDEALRADLQNTLRIRRLHEDWKKNLETLRSWSGVYGKNHPRMADLRKKTEDLGRQLAELPINPSLGAESHSASELLIAALDSQLESAVAAEHELREQIDRLGTAARDRDRRNTGLDEARRELAFLQQEHALVVARIQEHRQAQSATLPEIVESPTLTPEPVAPVRWYYLAIGGTIGAILSSWFFTRAFSPARVQITIPSVTPKTAAKPARPPRFRSEEEVKLARLKLRAPAGNQPVAA